MAFPQLPRSQVTPRCLSADFMRHALVLGDPQALATDKLSLRSLTAWAVALSTQGRTITSNYCAGNDGESILGFLGMRYRFVHFSPIHKQLHHGESTGALGDLRSENMFREEKQ